MDVKLMFYEGIIENAYMSRLLSYKNACCSLVVFGCTAALVAHIATAVSEN